MALDLFELLDRALLCDRQPPGLTGELAFAIRGPSGDRLWLARFGSTAESARVEAIPASTRALVLIGEEDAQHLARGAIHALRRRPPGAQTMHVAGDAAFFWAFVQRYLTGRNMVSVRFEQSRRSA